jgi:hypothetical protein
MSEYNWKLTMDGIDDLVSKNLVTQTDADQLVQKSLQRKPGTFDHRPIRFYLNKAKSIWVQSIHYYGGDHFKQPYYFLAEICHVTTNSCFSRFVNKYNPKMTLPWTY